jgi:hypothetical protein
VVGHRHRAHLQAIPKMLAPEADLIRLAKTRDAA